MLIFRDDRLNLYRSASIVVTLPLRRPVAVDVLGMVARANYLVKQGAGATGNLLNLVMDASEKDARCIATQMQPNWWNAYIVYAEQSLGSRL